MTRIYSPANPETDMPRTYKPDAQAKRYAKSEAELKAAGGRRLNVRLQPKTAKHLDKLVEKTGQDQTTIVNNAILAAR